MKRYLREIALGTAVVLATSLGIAGAIFMSSSNSKKAHTERASPLLHMQTVEIPTILDGEKVTSVALSGKGLLALGTVGGRVSILDGSLQAWRGGWERSGAPSTVSLLAFSSDGSMLAGVTRNKLLVWFLDSQEVREIPIKLPQSPSAIALSSGGRWLAVANFNIFVFDVAGKRLASKFEQKMQEGGIGEYTAIAFSPDATTIVAASGDSVDVWSVEKRERARPSWSCECGADGVALSSDAALAAFGTGDARVLLWDVSSAELIKDKTISIAQGDHVYATALSLMGMHVTAGTASGWFVVWNPSSNTILGRAQPSAQPIVRVKSSDDGRLFLVEGQKAEYVRGDYDRWLVTLAGD